MAVAISQTANPAGVAASSTIATYTGASIGTAASDRIVVVVVGTELASSTPSACTIDGTAMTAATTGNFGALYTRIFYKYWPTGTTAEFKVTFSATSPGDTANHIAVYKVTGASDTLGGEGGDGTTDAQDDLATTGSTTIVADGGMIGVFAGASDTTARTWSNWTEDIDADAGTFRFSTATYITAGTETRTVSGANNEDAALSWIILAPGIPQQPPTVVLDDPTAGETVTDTTPDLTFTGTDANSNTIEYQLQVSKSNTFLATGGTITTDGDYTVHTFTSNGTFTAFKSFNAEVLVVGGGGGGGKDIGGGGGAGGYVAEASHAITAQAYSITVGGGGNGATSTSFTGAKGGDSIFDDITAVGGGGGNSRNSDASSNDNGGSGGGACYDNATPGTGTAGQGNDGGTGTATGNGAGGGGAGAAGAVAGTQFTNGGNGGAGLDNDISGATLGYAGGGGGGVWEGAAGGTATHGGGAGGGDVGVPPVAGTANRGGGGGGGNSDNAYDGAAGGSGVVIIRYLTTDAVLNKLSVTPDATFTCITDGGDTHPFNSGNQVKYTVQAGDALTADTYYWRVRGTDPSGSNTYGAWSTGAGSGYESFVVSTAFTPKLPYIIKQAINRSNTY